MMYHALVSSEACDSVFYCVWRTSSDATYDNLFQIPDQGQRLLIYGMSQFSNFNTEYSFWIYFGNKIFKPMCLITPASLRQLAPEQQQGHHTLRPSPITHTKPKVLGKGASNDILKCPPGSHAYSTLFTILSGHCVDTHKWKECLLECNETIFPFTITKWILYTSNNQQYKS